MDTLTLGYEGGEIRLAGDTLVVALDDTGHEEFSDRNFQVFGIGGCAFRVADYRKLIVNPWEELIKRYFPNLQRPVHASKNLRSLSSSQIEAINSFFRTSTFFRLAVTVNSKAVKTVPNTYVEVVSTALLNRVMAIAPRVSFNGIAILVEASERLDEKIMQAISSLRITANGVRQHMEIVRVPKALCVPAIEVADVIVHTAGRYSKGLLSGNKTPPKDFEVIFRPADAGLVSYMNIDVTSPRRV